MQNKSHIVHQTTGSNRTGKSCCLDNKNNQYCTETEKTTLMITTKRESKSINDITTVKLICFT